MLDRPEQSGWLTTDEDEIALRRWRGRTEILAVEPREPDHPFFGTFRTQSGTGGFYDVEIRSLDGFGNSCGCIDHRVNRLGTCKHIEGVLDALHRRKARAFREAVAAGNPRIEIFLDRRDAPTPRVVFPLSGGRHGGAVRNWLEPFIDAKGAISAEPERIEALLAAWQSAPAPVRASLRGRSNSSLVKGRRWQRSASCRPGGCPWQASPAAQVLTALAAA